jgi:hypothetical protein
VSKEKVILTIRNGHIEACGKPPKLTLDGGRRTCYFENVHGEQFIMQFDPNTDICHLWSGDVGWEEELRVEEFRGKVIVRFARTQAEREAEFKMNRQFDHGLPPAPEEKTRQIREAVFSALRKLFGKPALTDAECEYVSDGPILSQDEREVITAYWNICKQLRT